MLPLELLEPLACKRDVFRLDQADRFRVRCSREDARQQLAAKEAGKPGEGDRVPRATHPTPGSQRMTRSRNGIICE